jgi:hypothetical protein
MQKPSPNFNDKEILTFVMSDGAEYIEGLNHDTVALGGIKD